jgi:hypothetical protein
MDMRALLSVLMVLSAVTFGVDAETGKIVKGL